MLRLQYALTTWFNGVQESKALALVLVLLSKEHSAMQLLVLVAAKANTNMANKFTRFLTDVFSGLTNPKGRVGNYTHATRLFIDDNFRLAPKNKFNYFVRFEID